MAISSGMLDRTLNITRDGSYAGEGIAIAATTHTEAVGASWAGAYHVQIVAPVGAVCVIVGTAADGVTAQTETITSLSGLVMSTKEYTALASISLSLVTPGDTFGYSVVDAHGVPAQQAATHAVASGVPAYVEDAMVTKHTADRPGHAQTHDTVILFNYTSAAAGPKKGDTISTTDYPVDIYLVVGVHLLRQRAGISHWEVVAWKKTDSA